MSTFNPLSRVARRTIELLDPDSLISSYLSRGQAVYARTARGQRNLAIWRGGAPALTDCRSEAKPRQIIIKLPDTHARVERYRQSAPHGLPDEGQPADQRAGNACTVGRH